MGLFGKKKNAEVIGAEGTEPKACSGGMGTGTIKVLGQWLCQVSEPGAGR